MTTYREHRELREHRLATARDLVDRVAADQLRVAWIAPGLEELQHLVRALRRQLYRAGSPHRVLVSRGIEIYSHRDGGRIVFVTPNANRLRGQTFDEVHDHSHPTAWPTAFAEDVGIVLATGRERGGPT